MNILFLAGCVTLRDTYPTGLKSGCKAVYSCVKLARTRKCRLNYWQAMPKCRGQIRTWWKTQLVKNHCKKSCNNCVRKFILFIMFVVTAYIFNSKYTNQLSGTSSAIISVTFSRTDRL